jgi:hypothetical protein
VAAGAAVRRGGEAAMVPPRPRAAGRAGGAGTIGGRPSGGGAPAWRRSSRGRPSGGERSTKEKLMRMTRTAGFVRSP